MLYDVHIGDPALGTLDHIDFLLPTERANRR